MIPSILDLLPCHCIHVSIYMVALDSLSLSLSYAHGSEHNFPNVYKVLRVRLLALDVAEPDRLRSTLFPRVQR